MIPTSIDGTDITGATIDGQDVQEITVDGQTVFSAGPAPGNFQFDAQDLNLADGDPVTSWPDTLGRDTLTGGQNLVYDTSTMNDASVQATNTNGTIESTNSALIDLCKTQDLTVTITFQLGSSLPNNNHYWGFDTGGGEKYSMRMNNKNSPERGFYMFQSDSANAANEVHRFTLNDNQPHIVMFAHSGGFASGVEFYVDDMVNVASSFSLTGDRGVDRTSFTGTNKFFLYGVPTNGLEMNVGFWRVDDKILTQAERQAIKDSRPEL